jgi:hypothetical protein
LKGSHGDPKQNTRKLVYEENRNTYPDSQGLFVSLEAEKPCQRIPE